MILNFDKGNGFIPAIIQDATTHQVLMLGYMNAEALEKTEKEGKVTFYSRTKQRLWTKGETSGNYLEVEKIIPDCDNDTLLIKAHPKGPVCHTGDSTCFGNKELKGFLYELEQVILDRYNHPAEDSYTNRLFNKGVNEIAQKVGEEAVELVIESKDNNDDLFKNEAADLLYHLLVLLRHRGVNLTDIEKVLKERHKK